MNMWKKIDQDKPEDDKNYLVSWKRADGKYAYPHRAYYSLEENKFFSLENNNNHPIVVDIYIEALELPK